MISGSSNQKGIMYQDNSLNVAAYSYYNEAGEIVCEAGSVADVQSIRDHLSREDGKRSYNFVMGILAFVIPLIIIGITILIFDEFWTTAAVTTFCIIASAPFLSICTVFLPDYDSKELRQQACKNHGAEHLVFDYQIKNARNNPDYNLEEIKKCNYIDSNCRTVNSASFVIFAAVLGWSIYVLPEIGLVQLGINLLVTVILLFLNIAVNPWNPLTVFQRGNVSKPTDSEINLAVSSMQALLKKREKAIKKKQAASKK